MNGSRSRTDLLSVLFLSRKDNIFLKLSLCYVFFLLFLVQDSDSDKNPEMAMLQNVLFVRCTFLSEFCVSIFQNIYL